jgi:hypothetical protein
LGDQTLDRKAFYKVCGVRRTLFNSALNSLVERGLIERSGLGTNAFPYLYKPSSSSLSNDDTYSSVYQAARTPAHNTRANIREQNQNQPVPAIGTTSEPPEPAEPDDGAGWKLRIGTAEDADLLLDYANKRINEA